MTQLFQLRVLRDNTTRRTFLITYSQVDLALMPDKQSFANAVLGAFQDSGSEAQPEHWSVSEEVHEAGGIHYHMMLKLSGPSRWHYLRTALKDGYNIDVHFSEGYGATYKDGYRYICKEDPAPLHSVPHPDLIPIKTTGSKSKKRTVTDITLTDQDGKVASERHVVEESKPSKSRRLSNEEVSDFIVSRAIKTLTDLHVAAQERKDEGESDLHVFILNHSKVKVTELIDTAWEMKNAALKLKRSKQTRIDIILEAAEEDCASGCGGDWFTMAVQVISQNGYTPLGFSTVVYDLLENGRGKYRNIIIIGPSNCGKTFLLSPLMEVFETFANPAQNKYAWPGVESAECIFLNNFRWNAEAIPWKTFLNLLEGMEVKMSSPKNQYAQDIIVKTDVPIFATSIAEIKMTTGDPEKRDDENHMMESRWRVFNFTHRIPGVRQRTMPRCKKCFARLVLLCKPCPLEISPPPCAAAAAP